MTKSPTLRLLLGLLITLAAVTLFCAYSLFQLHRLRKLQTDTIDLNRHDSLLLLQFQTDLNAIGLELRDMSHTPRGAGIDRYRAQFERLRNDLESAIRAEAQLFSGKEKSEREQELSDALAEFWKTSDQVFATSSFGQADSARNLALTNLLAQQSTLAARVSHLLARNNEVEGMADAKVASIYERSEHEIYAFLAATITAILVTSLYLIYSNRRLFERLESLSSQRRVLAARLIAVQEEVLRSVSRELHDEFGQILTAIGAMLSRAERKGVPPDSPLRTELSEIREITHNTMEKVRSLSQMLHPAVIDDYGLEKGLDWYTGVFQRQTGIQTTAVVTGNPVRITGQPAIHCFRVVQEALNNAAKHSGTKRAEVEMIFSDKTLEVKVRDFGRGFQQTKKSAKPGLGMIAMQERAEILCAQLEISSTINEGTTVSLRMPTRQEEPSFAPVDRTSLKEVLTQNS
jgi:signal transduction histidine kinase